MIKLRGRNRIEIQLLSNKKRTVGNLTYYRRAFQICFRCWEPIGIEFRVNCIHVKRMNSQFYFRMSKVPYTGLLLLHLKLKMKYFGHQHKIQVMQVFKILLGVHQQQHKIEQGGLGHLPHPSPEVQGESPSLELSRYPNQNQKILRRGK